MNILFISNASGPDYLSDTIFHGGKSLYGLNFYESNRMWYMYDDLQNKKDLYGRGFTMYGKIKKELYSTLDTTIEKLIEDKFFDKIIYGSIWRCDNYFDLVSKIYNKKDIIFIDGEDHGELLNKYINKGLYFKREYYSETDGVYPISFGIPEELVLENLTEKTKEVSQIIPDFNRNYIYDIESDYYKEYASSWFAYTYKKGGVGLLKTL